MQISPPRSLARSIGMLALVVLAGAPFATAQINPIPYGAYEAAEYAPLAWPAGVGGTGPIGRMLVGRLLDDEMPIVVALRGGVLVGIADPQRKSAFFVIGAPRLFRDFAIHTGTDGSDSLLGVTADGLFRYQHDPDAGDAGALVETALGSSIWNDATRVLTGDIDGLGGPDAIGLGASGSVLIQLLSGTGGSFTENSIPLPDVVYDFVVHDFFAGGDPEFVADTDYGLNVYDSAGVSQFSLRSAYPGGALALVRTNGETPNVGLSWTFRTGPNVFKQEYMTESSVETPLRLKLLTQDLQVYATTAADWDGDGQQDLLVCHNEFQRATILLNQGAPKHFKKVSPLQYELIDLVDDPDLPPAVASQCIFAFADLDSSGHAEVVAGLDSEGPNGTIQVVGLETESQAATKTVSGYEDGETPGFLFAEAKYQFHDGGTPLVASDDHGDLTISFADVPYSYLNGYTHCQIIEWSQHDPITSGPTYMSRIAVRNELYPIVGSALPNGVNPYYVKIDFDHSAYGEIYWSDRRHAYLELRFVTVDSNPTTPRVTSFTPSIPLGLTLRNEPKPASGGELYLAYLESLRGGPYDVDIVDELFISGPPPTLPTPDGSGVGGIVILDSFPVFVPGEAPAPGRPKFNPGSYAFNRNT